VVSHRPFLARVANDLGRLVGRKQTPPRMLEGESSVAVSS